MDTVSIQGGWETSKVRKHTLIMVCPKLKETQTVAGIVRKSCGAYVVEAIKEFLDYTDAKVEDKAGGFVVEHPNGEPHFIQLSSEEPPAELAAYQQMNEFAPGAASKWSFQFKR